MAEPVQLELEYGGMELVQPGLYAQTEEPAPDPEPLPTVPVTVELPETPKTIPPTGGMAQDGWLDDWLADWDEAAANL